MMPEALTENVTDFRSKAGLVVRHFEFAATISAAASRALVL